jgi:hypothetical protein
MSAVREAIVLPLLFLTVALAGGLEPGAPAPWLPPTTFSLVLAVMILATLVRSGALAPGRLLESSRTILENCNGFVVLISLFAASAQAVQMLTPRSGLPSAIVGIVLFLLLVNTLVVSPDRQRLLRSLGVTLGSAYLLKFVILAGLADPGAGRTARVLIAIFDAATFGTISQDRLPASSGYLAFVVVILYLAGVAALPTPNVQLPTPKSQLPSPKSQLPTPKSQLPSPKSQLPTPNSRFKELGRVFTL